MISFPLRAEDNKNNRPKALPLNMSPACRWRSVDFRLAASGLSAIRKLPNSSRGIESLAVMPAYLKDKDFESEEAEEYANRAAWHRLTVRLIKIHPPHDSDLEFFRRSRCARAGFSTISSMSTPRYPHRNHILASRTCDLVDRTKAPGVGNGWR